MDPLAALAVVVGVLSIATVLGTSYAVIKSSANKASLDLMSVNNTELRAENADVRRKMAENERECAQQLSRLEGRVQVLQDGLGKDLGRVLADALWERLEPLLTEYRSETDGS